MIVVKVTLTGGEADEASDEIGGALEDLRDSGVEFEFSIDREFIAEHAE